MAVKMISVLLTVVLFGVCGAQTKDVCYERYGCFSNNPPFHNLFVKLPQSPESVGTKFHLFTRSNRQTSQIINDSNRTKLQASSFDIRKKTFLVVHGFTENIYTWASDMKDALLDREDCNVILVDWSDGAQGPPLRYGQAAGNTRLVGAQLTELIKFVTASSQNATDRFCIVGFSLGAHIAGYAGRNLRNQGITLGRITGLDPAGLFFTRVSKEVKLDASDARFVDAIHTDAGGLGTSLTSGHIDFYPNGGSNQRGCAWSIFSISNVVASFSCNHMRAPEYYIASVKGDCSWKAYPCSSYRWFAKGRCRTCNGKCPSMGFDADQTKQRGKFFLKTNGAAPFCGIELAY